jgi:hypothetical protein
MRRVAIDEVMFVVIVYDRIGMQRYIDVISVKVVLSFDAKDAVRSFVGVNVVQ